MAGGTISVTYGVTYTGDGLSATPVNTQQLSISTTASGVGGVAQAVPEDAAWHLISPQPGVLLPSVGMTIVQNNSAYPSCTLQLGVNTSSSTTGVIGFATLPQGQIATIGLYGSGTYYFVQATGGNGIIEIQVLST